MGCEPGQGLINGICVDCNGPGQGTLNRDCVDCDTALEGSAPNADTGEGECLSNQIPSEDGKRCETVPDETPETVWCAIPCWEGYTNEDGGAGCDVRCKDGGCNDAWCNDVCNRPNPHEACLCVDAVDCDSLDYKFYHRCHPCSTIKSPPSTQYCPNQDTPGKCNAQRNECLEGEGWIDDPKNCVDCNNVLKNSFPNEETGECECRTNQILNDDGTKCIWDPDAPFDSSSKNGSDANTDCTDPTGCSEEDPTEMPSATPDMPSLPGSDSGSDAAAEETPSTTDRPSLLGSDSGSDAAAEETPSTTDRLSLLGSDSGSDAAAEETPSTTDRL